MILNFFLTSVARYDTYLIKTERHGNLRHYSGRLLEFTNKRPSDHFRFIKQNVLQEVKSGKCLYRRPDRYVDLTYNCDGPTASRWLYNSFGRQLKIVQDNPNFCLSPWRNHGLPREIAFHPGISVCAGWNRITLELGGYMMNICNYSSHNLTFRVSLRRRIATLIFL